MTTEETRQLGIEFERRVLTMIPETEFSNKLDTDTIYSYLNQYQDLYIETIFKNIDLLLGQDKRFPNIDGILQSLYKVYTVLLGDIDDYFVNTQQDSERRVSDTGRSTHIELPEDFYMYSRSVSEVSKTYRFNNNSTQQKISGVTNVVNNKFVSQRDLEKLLESPGNDLRILRQPVVALSLDMQKHKVLSIVFDRYTKIDAVRILYYKKPAYFSIITDTPCELPSSAFDDLVTGAVDLYTNYVAGAEARKRQMQEAAQKQNNKENKEN